MSRKKNEKIDLMDPNFIGVDNDEDPDSSITRADVIKLCEQLERLVVKFGDTTCSLELPHLLRKFHGQLRRNRKHKCNTENIG